MGAADTGAVHGIWLSGSRWPLFRPEVPAGGLGRRIQVDDFSVAYHQKRRSGLNGKLLGPFCRSAHRRQGTDYVGVVRLDFRLHRFLPFARSRGAGPKLSYNPQLSTKPLYMAWKFFRPASNRRRIMASGMLWPPCRTRFATRSAAASAEGRLRRKWLFRRRWGRR
jgi:hypothetical protein